MSLAYRLYTALLPRALRAHLDPLQKKYHEKKQARAAQRRKLQMGSAKALKARRKKLRSILKERPLRVAFQVAQLSKWKSEALLQLMLKSGHFAPCIWCVPFGKAVPAALEREYKLIVSAFSERGIRVYTHPSLDAFPADEKPDLIFIHEPYDVHFKTEAYRGLTEELICYVPYAFRNSNNTKAFDNIGNRCAVFSFVENEAFCDYIRSHAINKGRNCIVSGSPIADVFLNENAHSASAWKDCGKPMKKVIWAPHWTITPDLSWFVSGTFLLNAQAITELAEQYADSIQFAFKPHPHLYRSLCQHPDWGKEKADAFYQRWAEMPNTQLEEGPYTALFMQSDAIVHDSGSFIMEYLFADKPGLFLRENEGYGDYNDMTIDCLRAYQYGLTKADIEDFLQRCVLGTEDPKQNLRHTLRDTYVMPPHRQSAAQNILAAILNA